MPQARTTAQQLGRWYEQLLAQDRSSLQAMFAGEPRLDTPLDGNVRGRGAFDRYAREQREWLAARQARSRLLSAIDGAGRAVCEIELRLRHEGKDIDLPVALVADDSVRVYHSTWPLTGKHIVRAPLVAPDEHLEEPEPIHRYMQALARGELEAMLDLFASDAYVREPAGAQFRHAGPAGRRAFYEMALADGGVPLKHCTATFDGRLFAVEYVCDRWGKASFAPQAGMAVYELAGERVAAVRIYDDVTPPGETAS